MKVNREFTFLLLIFFSILTATCTNNTLQPKEYIKWIANSSNGLHKNKSVGHYTFNLQFKPIPFIIANELKKIEISTDAFNTRYKKLKGLQYYTLKIFAADGRYDIMKYGLEDKQDYFNRLQYFSFHMQQDIYLVENEIKIPCALYHFERTYGIAKDATFVLGFEQRPGNINSTKIFVLDSEHFGTGPIKIRIEEGDLTAIPKIELR